MSVIVRVHVAQIFLRAPLTVGRFLCAPVRAIFRFCDKIIIYHKSRARQKSLGSCRGNGMSNYITSNFITNVCQVVADFPPSSPPPAHPPAGSRIPGESYYVTSKEDNKWFAAWTRKSGYNDARASTNIYTRLFFARAWMTRDPPGREVQTNFIFETDAGPFYFIRGSICLCYRTTADIAVGL